MANNEAGGHWATLDEAKKLTQSMKIPGVIETDIKRNNPVLRMPVAQAAGTGLKIEWLREKSVTEDAVAMAGVGQQLVWGEDSTYTEVESTLRYLYIQRKLDRYVQNIYGTYTDYKAQVLLECEKGLIRKLGDKIVYGDETYGGTPTEFDGLHALAANTVPNYDGQEAYSDLNLDCDSAGLGLRLLRRMIDAMKLGCDEIWGPGCIGIRLDQAYEERGVYGVTDAGRSLLTRGWNEMGRPFLMFAGIPIVRTDFLVGETASTGEGPASGGANIRSKNTTTSSQMFTVFGVKYGNVMEKDPGICFAYGGTEGAGDLYELWTWERLEEYNAGGMRLDSYGTILLGAPMCLGRIFDVANNQVTV